jgi:hypothetical protein
VVAELWFEVVGGGRWGRLSPVIEEVGRGGASSRAQVAGEQDRWGGIPRGGGGG